MYGKTHSAEARVLISKPGELNPMFGKKHSLLTRQRISDKMSKHPEGLGIYDLNDLPCKAGRSFQSLRITWY